MKIPGLGPKRRTALETVGVKSVGDLLYYYPVRYIDRSRRVDIREAGNFWDERVTVRGAVDRARGEYWGRAKFRVTVKDGTGSLDAVWYMPSMKIAAGETLSLTGKVINNHGKLLMIHPTLEKITDKTDFKPVIAVYSVKESMREASIAQSLLRKSIEWAIKNVGNYPRVLPAAIEKKHNFPPLDECLRNIHLPEDLLSLDKYKQRLKYEELYRLALNLRWNKKKFALPGYAMAAGGLDGKLRGLLPFTLTQSQEDAVKVLYGDAGKPERMHRLLQGDVGSGKTVTALFAALPALNSGRQVAWMAPTEVLAKQTKNVVEKYLGQLGFRVEYLGAGDMSEKRKIHRDLASGQLRVVVGTHALFMPSVKFKNLGMVIIDEQHKFGAEQRAKLQEKGPASDFLLMSATPIPQTLAKTLYGDLDIVEIKSRPGRVSISTHIVPGNKRADMEKFILERITASDRVFYVVPRIDAEDDDFDGDDEDRQAGRSAKKSSAGSLGKPSSKNIQNDDPPQAASIKTVDAAVEKLMSGPLSSVPIHKLHGRMSGVEREESIRAFREGPPGVLAATTIVEVGVDIPDATVMVIESPEFFGLAQLHQIRGRVGRGERPSYCFLLPGAGHNEHTAERLRFLCGCADGFEIAEWDLRNRGPGDTAGRRQSGWDDLRAADILEDAEMFREILGEIDAIFAV